jgi:hypothetical protein
VPYLRRLPARFSPRKTGFSPIIVPDGHVVKIVKIIMGISGSKLQFSPVKNMVKMLHPSKHFKA